MWVFCFSAWPSHEEIPCRAVACMTVGGPLTVEFLICANIFHKNNIPLQIRYFYCSFFVIFLFLSCSFFVPFLFLFCSFFVPFLFLFLFLLLLPFQKWSTCCAAGGLYRHPYRAAERLSHWIRHPSHLIKAIWRDIPVICTVFVPTQWRHSVWLWAMRWRHSVWLWVMRWRHSVWLELCMRDTMKRLSNLEI